MSRDSSSTIYPLIFSLNSVVSWKKWSMKGRRSNLLQRGCLKWNLTLSKLRYFLLITSDNWPVPTRPDQVFDTMEIFFLCVGPIDTFTTTVLTRVGLLPVPAVSLALVNAAGECFVRLLALARRTCCLKVKQNNFLSFFLESINRLLISTSYKNIIQGYFHQIERVGKVLRKTDQTSLPIFERKMDRKWRLHQFFLLLCRRAWDRASILRCLMSYLCNLLIFYILVSRAMLKYHLQKHQRDGCTYNIIHPYESRGDNSNKIIKKKPGGNIIIV